MARGRLQDHSNSITSGTVSQVVAAANSSRSYLLFQNISDASLWLNFGAAASADAASILVPTNTSIIFDGSGFVPTDEVQVLGTTGKKFVCKEG